MDIGADGRDGVGEPSEAYLFTLLDLECSTAFSTLPVGPLRMRKVFGPKKEQVRDCPKTESLGKISS